MCLVSGQSQLELTLTVSVGLDILEKMTLSPGVLTETQAPEPPSPCPRTCCWPEVLSQCFRTGLSFLLHLRVHPLPQALCGLVPLKGHLCRLNEAGYRVPGAGELHSSVISQGPAALTEPGPAC